MAWHYIRDGVTEGPIDITELQRLHQEGVVVAETPVWTEGMAEWTPYQSSSAAASPVLAGTAVQAATLKRCVECGQSFPEDEMLAYEDKWVCAACKPVFFQRLREGVTLPGNLAYASIGKRFAAVFIDSLLIDIIILGPVLIFLGIGGLTAKGRADLPPSLNIIITISQYLLPALYEIILIGKYGATLGKMAMKIKVVTPEGGPISYARATGRHFAKILSAITLCIGYLIAFWDPEKRALHDRMCTTRVISDPS